MLAARDDEIVAPEQLLAARHLVGSKERQICTDIVACTHLGEFWPQRLFAFQLRRGRCYTTPRDATPVALQ